MSNSLSVHNFYVRQDDFIHNCIIYYDRWNKVEETSSQIKEDLLASWDFARPVVTSLTCKVDESDNDI
jgi:hypothetical protein